MENKLNRLLIKLFKYNYDKTHNELFSQYFNIVDLSEFMKNNDISIDNLHLIHHYLDSKCSGKLGGSAIFLNRTIDSCKLDMKLIKKLYKMSNKFKGFNELLFKLGYKDRINNYEEFLNINSDNEYINTLKEISLINNK